MENLNVEIENDLLVFSNNYSVKQVADIIVENNLSGLKIFSYLKDEMVEDLSFLTDIPFIKVLQIISVKDYDFSFLSSLKELRELSIQIEGKNTIDVSELSHLVKLNVVWRKSIIGISKCLNLKELILIQLGENDLGLLENGPNLEKLVIKQSSLLSVNGISSSANLKHVELSSSKKLIDIQDIKHLTSLEELIFDGCPKIKDFSVLSNCVNLASLRLDDCGKVESIKFIEQLKNISRLTLLGNTEIEDNDLTPAKEIKEVFYRHKKTYNIKINNEKEAEIIRKNKEKLKLLLGG